MRARFCYILLYMKKSQRWKNTTAYGPSNSGISVQVWNSDVLRIIWSKWTSHLLCAIYVHRASLNTYVYRTGLKRVRCQLVEKQYQNEFKEFKPQIHSCKPWLKMSEFRDKSNVVVKLKPFLIKTQTPEEMCECVKAFVFSLKSHARKKRQIMCSVSGRAVSFSEFMNPVCVGRGRS